MKEINGSLTPVKGLIMTEGHRGSEMWIINEGQVVIETGLHDDNEDGEVNTLVNRLQLGVLGSLDVSLKQLSTSSFSQLKSNILAQ